MQTFIMEKISEKAWEILKEDEKTSLSLSLGHGKSTWESGEIMGRAHFKYLEIQKRAAKFLEIFTNHFEKYGEFIPIDLELPFSFIEFLQLTMLERKNISTAVKEMDSKKYLINSTRTTHLTKEINKLKNSPRESANELYNIIMDFDRWNNFRILPVELQEPSAFKRRNKARNKKHLINITSLPEYSLLTLVEKFNYTGKYNKLYLPLISKYFPIGHRIVPIKDMSKNINKVTSIGLFLFNDRAKAQEFAELVYDYFYIIARTCKTGQKFWPKFRELMAEALNYKELENIHKSRTYLDNAIFEKKLVKKENKIEDRIN